ncbi:hypothetical protein VitviT2T_027640 [Vitis vinifera]|uniref:Cytochrome b6-f complex subunit 7 n=2 Tax=Vitis vinifera TaxID=29760 RepID=A0ABY9DQK3_VITVI|eukprot:XP_002284054.1 PREDICTED: uncharacterized protein LOC100264352 [Vitis vinifera]
MATASAILCPATVTARVRSSGSKTQKGEKKVVYVAGLNSFGGLKAHNSVVAMGVPMCTEQCFANVVSSLKAKGRGGGGALSSTCSAASEIFRIAAIMNALVLIGVAVGFVLLRIEASVEESE